MAEPTILFEDDSLVVVDKPAGIIVHPDGKHDYPALTAWLEARYTTYFLVHRLDRETSGVLVVAKTEEAYENLKAQFAERGVQKTYRAFVYGTISEARGIIDKPIGSSRDSSGPRSALRPHGELREATTVYRRLARSAGATYVEVFPKTGRTHQIRVHFASVQHPVVGDRLYAPRRRAILGFRRLALHALSLSFVHPKNGTEMSLSAPLPPDFVAAEEKLRNAQ